MKKLTKLAAAVAVALSVGVAPQANALVELKANGRGDALLFPVFNGYLENYFTIQNTDNNWIQAHIRFRGAAWSGELLDFDVILSPGDVFVFRMADVDGDGYWEVDQSVDPNNFKWAGILQLCGPEVNGVQGAKTTPNCIDQSSILIPDVDAADNRIQYDYTAIPYPANLNQSQRDEMARSTFEHQRHVGYVEFIGEGIFLDLTQTNDQFGRYVPTHALMNQLADPANRGKLAAMGQREVKSPYDGVGYGQIGTSLWSWVDAQNAGITNPATGEYGPNKPGVIGYHRTRIAKDVGNSLGGTAFITLPGQSQGVAYNAEALVNFRTTQFSHRIENYPLDYPTHGNIPGEMPILAPGLPITAANVDFSNTNPSLDGVQDGRAVILHDENSIGPAGGLSPIGDYVYTMMPDRVPPEPTTDRGEDRSDESRISFNNTWGPTLADGDDAEGTTNDTWDINLIIAGGVANKWPVMAIPTYVNSIDELEDAILADGQDFSTFYFDGRGLPHGQGVSSKYALHSLFFAYFPTKFYYGERPNYYLCNKLLKTDGSCAGSYYLKEAVRTLLSYGKPVTVEIWDTDERTPTAGPTLDCPQSPCLSSTAAPSVASIGSELALFNVAWVKNLFSGAEGFEAGRISVRPNNTLGVTWGGFAPAPFLLYTLETMNPLSNPDQVHGISNWRSMHR